MFGTFDPSDVDSLIPGILLLTHGPLGMAMIESLRMLCLGTKNVVTLCLEEDDSFESYHTRILEILLSYPAGCIVMIDLYGGRPSEHIRAYLSEQGMSCHAITGVNMPMLIEAIALRGSMSNEKLVGELEQIGKMGIVNLKKLLRKDTEREEK
ncbi:hypothetical protein LJC55_00420 [Eubacteriales bacterium OttesenSCG-928-N14]|nr:hypothetical protein [Eubacteriales bacterium OttesenSCG-928-N14]